MRHRLKRHHLNRFTSWRKATLRSMAKNILLHQSIRTTVVKAKAARPLVEQLITLAKENTLSARRKAYQVLGDHALVKVLFNEIGPLFAKRTGGYTRIIGLGNRRGDNAELALFELTEIIKKESPRVQKKKKLPAKPEAPQTPHESEPEKKKKDTGVSVKEKPPMTQKPGKKFLGNLRSIFKKERDSL